MLPIAVSCHRAHSKNIGTMMNAKKIMTSFARIAIDVGCSQGKVLSQDRKESFSARGAMLHLSSEECQKKRLVRGRRDRSVRLTAPSATGKSLSERPETAPLTFSYCFTAASAGLLAFSALNAFSS